MSPTAAYRAWHDLGAGGLPHDVGGGLVATALRPLGRDTTDVTGLRAEVPAAPTTDDLVLPTRAGPRPRLAPEPVPHRQTTQFASAPATEGARRLADDLAAAFGAQVEVRRSHFERHGDALVAVRPRPEATWLVRARGEFAHRHGSDGSWHVVLHPAHAAAVVDAAWGELHPLAGRPLLGLPSTYVILYAPRDPAELDVLERIVRAAARWGGSVDDG